MNLLIKNGIVVRSESPIVEDILVRNGKIEKIEPDINPSGNIQVIDVKGKYVFPGGVDGHVHFGLRVGGRITSDDMKSGSMAAIAGGITTIIDYTDPAPGNKLIDTYKFRRSEGDSRVYCDYSLHGVVTDFTKETEKQLEYLLNDGVTSFKIFMVYDQKISEKDMINLLHHSSEKNFLVEVHCENPHLLSYMLEKTDHLSGMKGHINARPPIVEYLAIEEACAMAELTGGNLHIVHISTGEGGKIVKKYRINNKKISGETAPQYLFLSDDILLGEDGHLFASCPQIKSKWDGEILSELLIDGSLSFVATDHCIFTREEKNSWNGDFTKVPYGLPGVETSLPLLYTNFVKTGKITEYQFAKIVSENPAKRFGLYPKKGRIEIGSDGDFLIISPDDHIIVDGKNLRTKVDYSPYDGEQLYGFPHITILRGDIVYQNGKVMRNPTGRYVKRTVPMEV
jgi:dihydropyrimidinase